MQKRGAGKEFFEWLAQLGLFARRVIFVCRQNFLQNRSRLFARSVSRQLLEHFPALGGLFIFRLQIIERGQPFLAPAGDGVAQPCAPFHRLR